MDRLEAARFEPLVGSKFDVLDTPTPVSIALTKLIVHAKSPNAETFSLFFRGPLSPLLLQGIRKLRHTELGEIEIFLVPVTNFDDGYEYEAVFNYILKLR